MRDYMDWRVAAPKQVTSPGLGSPPPCKQALRDAVRKVWSVFTHVTCSHANRPFPSSKNPLFQNEVNCKMSGNEFYLHENIKSFSYQWLCT